MEQWETGELRERLTRIDDELAQLEGLLEDNALYRIEETVEFKPPLLDPSFRARLFAHLQRGKREAHAREQALKKEYVGRWQQWSRQVKEREVEGGEEDLPEQAAMAPFLAPSHASILGRNPPSTANNQQKEIPPALRWLATLATPPPQAIVPAPLAYLNDNLRWNEPVQPAVEPQQGGLGLGNLAIDGSVWTVEEQQIFVERYVQYPKQFHKIAAALPHKSCSDCVLFYYRCKHPLRLKQRAMAYRRGAPAFTSLQNSSGSLYDSGSKGSRLSSAAHTARRGRPPKSRPVSASEAEEGEEASEDGGAEDSLDSSDL